MKTRLLYSVIFALFGCSALLAQTGEIEGRLVDELGDGVAFANVALYKGTDLIRGVETDIDGVYLIRGLDAGTYDVEATYVGYATQRQEGVIVSTGIIRLDFIMTEGVMLDDIVVIGYEVPLIEVDKTSTGGTLTGKDIANLPIKDIGSLVGATAGVATSGEDVQIKGSRPDATVYYLDGVRVSGTLPPQTEIEQLQVITGGLSSKYGDVTGGVISFTSKGPSSKFSGGLELETSEGLDPYGYNLINGNISGPILKNKETDRSILGFRLSGQYRREQDDAPSAVGVYRAPESEIRRLEASPVNAADGSPLPAAESIDPTIIELLDARPNEEADRLDITGKIDARLSDNIDITLSGTYVDESDRFAPTNTAANYYGGGSWSLFNHVNNPLQTSSRYRGNFRFRHRLGGSTVQDDDENKKRGLIENISYTLQFGAEKFESRVEDIRHGENFFNHGYIGNFENSQTPIAELRTDRNGEMITNPLTGIEEFWQQTGYFGQLENYTPSDINPALASQNNFFSDGLRNQFDEYLWFNGKEESTLSSLWLDLYNNVGTVYNRFQKSEFERYTVNVSSTFDLYPGKSKDSRHNIEFGFNYEQIVRRSWRINPQELWTVARQQANVHLADIDTTQIIGTFEQEIYGNMVTFNQYERGILPSIYSDPDAAFFRNIRSQISASGGGPVRDIDFVDTDALDPSLLSLDQFSASELNARDLVYYYGYDYAGNKLPSGVTYNDFFTSTDANGARTFDIAPLEPLYWGAYVQDKFSFKDVIFKVGVRLERFDANTSVLKDPNSLYAIETASDFFTQNPNIPRGQGVQDDFLVYTRTEGGTDVVGYRRGSDWFNLEGGEVNSPDQIFQGNIVRAALKDPDNNIQNFDPEDSMNNFNISGTFKDYEPELKVLPRIAVSFPISDEANFFAHYDVLVQRPSFFETNATQFDYYYFERESGGVLGNPDLKPQTTIDYEIGFKQKISNTAAITIGAYYKELRDNIQRRTFFNLPLSKENSVSQYTTYDNIDFGTTKGFTFQLDMRRSNNFKVNLNYTLAFADGTGSDVNSSAGLTQNEVIRTLSPLTFDERHKLVVIADYRFTSGKTYTGPKLFGADIFSNTGLNLKADLISGRPYTAADRPSALPNDSGNGFAGTVNGARQPWTFKIDARLDKDFRLTKQDAKNRLGLNVYLRVTNLLDADNVRRVYDATGSAEDDGFLASQEGQQRLRDMASDSLREAYQNAYTWAVLRPGYYLQPRRIFLGAIFSF